MEQGFVQRQQQSQRLALTLSMRQSIAMLQKDVVDLTAFLKDASLSNPLFDVHSNLEHIAMRASNEIPPAVPDNRPQSLFAYLLNQVNLTMRQTPLRALVIELIGHLNPSGFFDASEAELVTALGTTTTMIQDATELLQQLDPPGIGSHSLQECLLLQARADEQAPSAVLELLGDNYAALIQKDWQRIKTQQQLSEADLQASLDYIAHLTANPGAQFESAPTQFILPDLTVHQQSGQLQLRILQHGQPQLVFANDTYNALQQENDASINAYLTAKRQEYRALQDSLQKRQETLKLVGQLIVEGQHDFLCGNTTTLQPLLARDIAQRLQLNTSTISRAIANKYIQTDQGLFPMSFFLTRRSTTAPDGQDVSTDEVIAKLKQLIAQEPTERPYSDQKLATQLTASGYPLARRTVAKYREQLGIATARTRKRMC